MIIDVNTVFGVIPKDNFDASVERLKELIGGHGISKVCSLSLKGLYYDFKEGNDETWSVAQENEEIIPVATINPRKYVGCWEEVGRCVELGFKLFKLFPNEQGWGHDYAPFSRLLKIIGEYSLPILLPASSGMTPMARIASHFKTPVIFTGVSYGNLSEALVIMEETPDIYIETSRLNTPDAYELIVETVGPGRVLFGSGAPLEHIGSVLEPIMKAEISQGARQSILGGNLLELLDMA